MTDAILLVTSGVGPVEARRFVGQLAERLEMLAEARGLGICEVVSQGDGALPRSVAIRVEGDASVLLDQVGTHVLIHRSSERGRAARKRWFAAVSVCEATTDTATTENVPRSSVVITACRAGGPGGQHVNKVSSAVRVQHVPSGLSVRSSGSRSQKANLEHALRRLASLLREQSEARQADATRARRGRHYQLERGRPVCTYHLDAEGALVERGRA